MHTIAKTEATILVVEDERKILTLLQGILAKAGYKVLYASNFTQAMKILERSYIDLVLLDWMLGSKDGLDIFRSARKNNKLRDIPFILLTARNSVEDQVYGLDQGVVDYITKPFDSKMLLARIRSGLLYHARKGNQTAHAGQCSLDISNGKFTTPGGSIKLDPSDCRMLLTMMQRADTPVQRSSLLSSITVSTNQHIEIRTVDVHISRIRKRLAKTGQGWRIRTIRSMGYMLVTGDKEAE